MPKFRVLEKSFIHNAIHEAGAVVDFDGIPGPNLEPIDKAGEKAVKAAESTAEVDLIRQQAAAKGVGTEQLPGGETLLA